MILGRFAAGPLARSEKFLKRPERPPGHERVDHDSHRFADHWIKHPRGDLPTRLSIAALWQTASKNDRRRATSPRRPGRQARLSHDYIEPEKRVPPVQDPADLRLVGSLVAGCTTPTALTRLGEGALLTRSSSGAHGNCGHWGASTTSTDSSTGTASGRDSRRRRGRRSGAARSLKVPCLPVRTSRPSRAHCSPVPTRKRRLRTAVAAWRLRVGTTYR